MARPGELAALIADLFGLEVTTVREQARVLRNAGLMGKEKGGRGPGSMSVRDATNLLIAVAGTSVVRDSVAPVAMHGNMTTADGRWDLSFAPISELQALSDDHTLAEAIEAMIKSAVDGSLEAGRGTVMVNVTLFDPVPLASIEICATTRDADGEVTKGAVERKEYRIQFGREASVTTFDPPLIARLPSDLKHQHSFSEATVLQIATLF